MQETRDAVVVALVSRFGEIDIGRLVWPKKRRHLSPLRHPRSRRYANRLPVSFSLTFVGLADHSTNLRSDQRLGFTLAFRANILPRIPLSAANRRIFVNRRRTAGSGRPERRCPWRPVRRFLAWSYSTLATSVSDVARRSRPGTDRGRNRRLPSAGGKRSSAAPNGAADRAAGGSADRARAGSLPDCWSDRCPGAPRRARRASSETELSP